MGRRLFPPSQGDPTRVSRRRTLLGGRLVGSSGGLLGSGVRLGFCIIARPQGQKLYFRAVGLMKPSSHTTTSSKGDTLAAVQMGSRVVSQ